MPIAACQPPQCQLTSVTLTPDARRAYVTQLSPGLVYVVDVDSKQPITSVSVGAGRSGGGD